MVILESKVVHLMLEGVADVLQFCSFQNHLCNGSRVDVVARGGLQALKSVCLLYVFGFSCSFLLVLCCVVLRCLLLFCTISTSNTVHASCLLEAKHHLPALFHYSPRRCIKLV